VKQLWQKRDDRILVGIARSEPCACSRTVGSAWHEAAIETGHLNARTAHR